MGACSCFTKSSSADQNEYSTEEKIKHGLNRRDINDNTPGEFDEDKIIKIQSHFRGAKARKEVDKLKLEQYKQRVIEQLHAYADSMAHQKGHHQKLDHFNYEENELEDTSFYSRSFKPATEFPGGGIYVGEW